MPTPIRGRIRAQLAAIAIVALAPGAASASLMSCVGAGYDLTGNVVPNSGCQISSETNDSTSGGNANFANFTVNAEGFFGFSDWLFDGKALEVGAQAPTLIDFTGDAQSGTWELQSVPVAVTELMMIFKAGTGTSLVGYLIDPATVCPTCTYDSPFLEPPFNIPGNPPQGISHISVYFREDGGIPPVLIAEPGALGLLAIGLGALGWAGRRSRPLRRMRPY